MTELAIRLLSFAGPRIAFRHLGKPVGEGGRIAGEARSSPRRSGHEFARNALFPQGDKIMRLLPEIATIDDGSVAHSRRIVRLRDAVEKVVAVAPGGDRRVRILVPQLGLPRPLI